jgi:hypothetical protein
MRSDLLRWGGAQAIGAFLTVAILSFQIHYHLIPPAVTIASLKSIAWPYLALLSLLIGAAALSAGVKLDNQREGEIREHQESKQLLEGELQSARRMLAGPDVPQLEQDRRESVQRMLLDFSDDEKQVLRYLLHNGQQHGINLPRLCGVPADTVSSALFKQRHVLTEITPLRSGVSYWEIKSELRDALAFHLFGG